MKRIYFPETCETDLGLANHAASTSQLSIFRHCAKQESLIRIQTVAKQA